MTTLLRHIPKAFACAMVFLTGTALASNAETIPLPRERPPVLEEGRSSAPKIESERSPCQLQLNEIAEFKPEPPITGPGECTATDVVNVNAVLLPDNHRVVFSPTVTLRCSMAETVAHWLRDHVAPTLGTLGMSLRGVETLELFGCRTFNGISGAKLSEHGRANALDVRSLKLANGAIVELTNASVSKALREQLRETTCARFSTVLGSGADAYHESHVHIDQMQRSNNYKICQWNILDADETAALVAKKSAAVAASIPEATQSNEVPVPRPRPLANADTSDLPRQNVLQGTKEGTMRSSPTLPLAVPMTTSAGAYTEEQPVTVGPWTISTSFKADKFDSCSMSRSIDGIDIALLRDPDGLLLFLQSEKMEACTGQRVYRSLSGRITISRSESVS